MMTPEFDSLARQLLAAAEKATPSRWFYDGYSRIVAESQVGDLEDDKPWYICAVPADHGDTAAGQDIHNANYIALANPVNIQILIGGFQDELKQTIARMQAKIERLEEALQDAIVLAQECANDTVGTSSGDLFQEKASLYRAVLDAVSNE